MGNAAEDAEREALEDARKTVDTLQTWCRRMVNDARQKNCPPLQGTLAFEGMRDALAELDTDDVGET